MHGWQCQRQCAGCRSSATTFRGEDIFCSTFDPIHKWGAGWRHIVNLKSMRCQLQNHIVGLQIVSYTFVAHFYFKLVVSVSFVHIRPHTSLQSENYLLVCIFVLGHHCRDQMWEYMASPCWHRVGGSVFVYFSFRPSHPMSGPLGRFPV